MSRLDSDDERAAQSREIAALVELAIAGDSAAFEQIVMRTERRQRKPRETCRVFTENACQVMGSLVQDLSTYFAALLRT